jgi:hypothetical protein
MKKKIGGQFSIDWWACNSCAYATDKGCVVSDTAFNNGLTYDSKKETFYCGCWQASNK